MNESKWADGVIGRALADDRALTRVLFDRGESLSRVLPYDEVSDDGQVFTLKDGSLGTVLIGTPLEHEVMTADDIVSAVHGLWPWLGLPETYVLQVIFNQSAVAESDPVFRELAQSQPHGNPVAKMLFDERLQEMRGDAKAKSAKGPLKRELVLALRHFPSRGGEGRAWSVFQNGERLLYRGSADYIREMKAFRATIEDFTAKSKVPLRIATPDEVLSGLRRFFNPKAFYERTFASHSAAAPFGDQIVYTSPVLDHRGIERQGVKSRTISLKASPDLVYPGGMAYFTALPFPYRLALNFSFPAAAKVKKFFDMKEFFLENTPSAKSRRQRDEILRVQDQLARDNRVVHLTMTIVIEGETDDELDQRARAVLGIMQNDLGTDGIVEERIGLGLCLNTLPLVYTAKADYSSQRFIRILRSDATRLLPVFDSFRGLSKPTQVHLSRERNLVSFSLTTNETSNHTVVLADSGSGKSAFILDCIQAAKREAPEPLVFVIDKKSSYLTIAKYFDADLTVFDRGGELPFSPFRGDFDDEKVAFLTNLVATGIKLTSPSFKLESEELTVLSRAIREAHALKVRQAGLVYDGSGLRQEGAGSTELGMEDVVTELGSLASLPELSRFQDVTERLVKKLQPFYGGGIYAPFFKAGGAKEKESVAKLFYIYDLDRLSNDPTLQALMTMAVVEEIRQTIKREEHQGRGGFIVLEELGMLGRDNPHAAQFIKDAAETFRKLGFWLIGLTPRPENYFETEAGRAMWGVADNFIFLQMSEDNVRYLAEHSALLDEATLGIVKSLRTVRGEYADIFYTNKKKSRAGAFRFAQTKKGRWLAASSDKDLAKIERALKAFGGDKWRALKALAEGKAD